MVTTTPNRTTTTQASPDRWPGIDQIKGLLMLLVVFGHTIPNYDVSQDLTKWIIYGVHMPAFLFISGFLVNAAILRQRTLWQYAACFGRRLLLPWVLVSLVWSVGCSREVYAQAFHHGQGLGLLKMTALWWFHPYFHLWYIPAMFVMQTLTWLAVRARPGVPILLAAGMLLAALLPIFPYQRVLPHHVVTLLGDWRTWHYLIYFVLGFCARNGLALFAGGAWRPRHMLPAFAVAFAGYIACCWLNPGWPARELLLLANLALALRLADWATVLHLPGVVGVAVAEVGRQSLWVYLLHPFVTEPLCAHQLPGLAGKLVGLLATFALVAVLTLAAKRMSAFVNGRGVPANGRPAIRTAPASS